ncbi:MAG: hypothetical protein WAV07_03035 [Candidatus Contendobacter sp.]
MWKDPILEEVRKARDDHAARFNYDLQLIYRALKEEEVKSGRGFIRLSPKRIESREERLKESEA